MRLYNRQLSLKIEIYLINKSLIKYLILEKDIYIEIKV